MSSTIDQGLRDAILAAAAECWSPDGTDFYTGMLADRILAIPEIAEALAVMRTAQGKEAAEYLRMAAASMR